MAKRGIGWYYFYSTFILYKVLIKWHDVDVGYTQKLRSQNIFSVNNIQIRYVKQQHSLGISQKNYLCTG